MTSPKRAEIPLFILTALGLAVVAILMLTGHAVPAFLWSLVGIFAAGGLGLAQPGPIGPTPLPSDTEIQRLMSAVMKVIPAAIADVEGLFDSPTPAQTSHTAATAPPVAASVTSIVRPTEPPTAS